MRFEKLVLLVLLVATPTQALAGGGLFGRRGRLVASGCPGGRCAAPSAQVQYQYAPVQAPVQAPAPAPAAPSASSYVYPVHYQVSGGQAAPDNAAPVQQADPYGVVAYVNTVRARVGLPGVVYSAQLESDAAVNSGYGRFAHLYMGSARRQNVGWGAQSEVFRLWLSSGPHYAALVDPTVSQVGIAYVNGIWTINLR